MSEAVIQINNLTKVYSGNIRAVEDLTMQVNRGEIFGYLGPNGAGKTTTIRLLLDLIRPTKGSATIFGQDVQENSVTLHQRIGFLPGELNLWKNRTAQQVVNYVASVRGNAKAQQKEAVELAETLQFDLTRRMRDYSTGNKRKLGLILAMMHRPELLILDEPTSGLDPLMQQTFNQMMRDIRDEGRTVFLSSHMLSEVQAICERVAIIRDGKLQAVENVDKLTHVEFRYVTLRFKDPVPQAWLPRLQDIDSVSDVNASQHELRLTLNGDFDPLLRAVSDGYIEDIRVEEPSLEEIFLNFYGGTAQHETNNQKVKV